VIDPATRGIEYWVVGMGGGVLQSSVYPLVGVVYTRFSGWKTTGGIFHRPRRSNEQF